MDIKDKVLEAKIHNAITEHCGDYLAYADFERAYYNITKSKKDILKICEDEMIEFAEWLRKNVSHMGGRTYRLDKTENNASQLGTVNDMLQLFKQQK